MINKTLALILCLLCFITGLYSGSVLQQEHFIKGAYEIAQGFEGSNIELTINMNETILAREERIPTVETRVVEERIRQLYQKLKKCKR